VEVKRRASFLSPLKHRLTSPSECSGILDEKRIEAVLRITHSVSVDEAVQKLRKLVPKRRKSSSAASLRRAPVEAKDGRVVVATSQVKESGTWSSETGDHGARRIRRKARSRFGGGACRRPGGSSGIDSGEQGIRPGEAPGEAGTDTAGDGRGAQFETAAERDEPRRADELPAAGRQGGGAPHGRNAEVPLPEQEKRGATPSSASAGGWEDAYAAMVGGPPAATAGDGKAGERESSEERRSRPTNGKAEEQLRGEDEVVVRPVHTAVEAPELERPHRGGRRRAGLAVTSARAVDGADSELDRAGTESEGRRAQDRRVLEHAITEMSRRLGLGAPGAEQLERMADEALKNLAAGVDRQAAVFRAVVHKIEAMSRALQHYQRVAMAQEQQLQVLTSTMGPQAPSMLSCGFP
jgi:hypothetical protein